MHGSTQSNRRLVSCSAQALNNWGLVLQELTALRPPSERAYLVDAAVSKFRRAIRLRPDFDRACYNLGTVCYAHASALKVDDIDEVGSSDARYCIHDRQLQTVCERRGRVDLCTAESMRLALHATVLGLHVSKIVKAEVQRQLGLPAVSACRRTDVSNQLACGVKT